MSPSTAPLWTATDARIATGGETSGNWIANGLSIDSRTLQPGDLFVALRGPHFDGHDFLEQAFAAGASAAMVARDASFAGGGNGALLRVDDTLEGLRALARAARNRTGARVIAVTGSAGKTSVKESLRAALAPQAKTHASRASHNNHWGVPFTLAAMPADCAYAVVEAGMNHAGELTDLSRLIRPHIAVVTNIAPAHLAFFDSIEDLADAKAEIFAGLDSGGVAVLNRDDPHFGRLSDAAEKAGAGKIVGFGDSDAADARLVKARLHDNCSCVCADILGQPMTFKVAAPGRHMVMNSLAMLACVRLLDADLAVAALQIASLEPPPGRGRRYRVPWQDGEITLIDESYNANPASMRAALAALGVRGDGRRIAVLGDMLELGDTSPDLHAGLANDIIRADIAMTFLCGPAMNYLFRALPAERCGGYAETPAELLSMLTRVLLPGDLVMVKGSLASGMGAIVRALRDDSAPNGAAHAAGHR